MHVGRAQSVPSGVQTRVIRARSLRTSVVELGVFWRKPLFRSKRMCRLRTCKTCGFLEGDPDFGGVPATVITV